MDMIYECVQGTDCRCKRTQAFLIERNDGELPDYAVLITTAFCRLEGTRVPGGWSLYSTFSRLNVKGIVARYEIDHRTVPLVPNGVDRFGYREDDVGERESGVFAAGIHAKVTCVDRQIIALAEKACREAPYPALGDYKLWEDEAPAA